MVRPAPSAADELPAPEATVILRSSTLRVAVSIVVVLPLTTRLPVIVRFPPTLASAVTVNDCGVMAPADEIRSVPATSKPFLILKLCCVAIYLFTLQG